MVCLGINEDFYDAGVALCENERVLFAANEERYTRRKNEGGFPHHALAGLLEFTKIDPADIKHIYLVGHMTPPMPVRIFPKLHTLAFGARRSNEITAFKRFMDFVMFGTSVSHTSEESVLRKLTYPLLAPVTRRKLPKALRRTPITFVDHHRSHASVAWRLSGYEEVLAITADGMGDGVSMTVSRCDVGKGPQRLWSASSRDSFGLFFETLTEAFGFIPCRDEGKITGLAAGGDPERVKEPSPFVIENGRLRYTGLHGYHGVAWARETLCKRYAREDVAAWAQHILETNVVEIARWWIRETGLHHIAVAGGVFANVKLNQRLHAMPEVDELFVNPNMGDGGLSLGAICTSQEWAPRSLRTVFFGESYTPAEIEAALKHAGLAYTSSPDPEGRVAELLAQGHIVGRFDGRMEWGPRALGNRSILVRTTDRQVVDRLNTLLKRSDFMPFAPAILDEDAELYLNDVQPARHAAEFMTVCFDCTDRMKREHPAVVHVDGTARAQLVTQANNPAFHRILDEYKKRSGHGVVLNTSFNIHEEPIIRTPDEAITAFQRARLDYLAIGPFLVQSVPR